MLIPGKRLNFGQEYCWNSISGDTNYLFWKSEMELRSPINRSMSDLCHPVNMMPFRAMEGYLVDMEVMTLSQDRWFCKWCWSGVHIWLISEAPLNALANHKLWNPADSYLDIRLPGDQKVAQLSTFSKTLKDNYEFCIYAILSLPNEI